MAFVKVLPYAARRAVTDFPRGIKPYFTLLIHKWPVLEFLTGRCRNCKLPVVWGGIPYILCLEITCNAISDQYVIYTVTTIR